MIRQDKNPYFIHAIGLIYATRVFICAAVITDKLNSNKQADVWFRETLVADLQWLKDVYSCNAWSAGDWTEFWKACVFLSSSIHPTRIEQIGRLVVGVLNQSSSAGV